MRDYEALLDELKQKPWHRAPGFVRDGIIDTGRWMASAHKVAFLLNEAYGDPKHPEDWDLRVQIRDIWHGPKHSMWHAVAHLAHVVQDLSQGSVTPFEMLHQEREAARRALLGSAVINIKKSAGKPFSEGEDLKHYVARDGAQICEQVALLAPDVLICGSTWRLVSHLWPRHRKVGGWVYDADGMTVVDFWHPAVRQLRVARKHYYLLDEWLRAVSLCRRTVRNPSTPT